MAVFDLDLRMPVIENEPSEEAKEKVQAKVKKRRIDKSLLLRAYSETELLDIMPKHFTTNDAIHVMTGNDIDALSFLKWVLRKQDILELLISTWVMAMADVHELDKYKANGQIKKINIYVGEIFQGSYPSVFEQLKKTVLPDGRLTVFKNHSKVMTGSGTDFYFTILSSANVNTNPRTENTVLFFDKETHLFYKNFYKGVKSFNYG